MIHNTVDTDNVMWADGAGIEIVSWEDYHPKSKEIY
jgi:hypothetical protein